MDQVELRAGGVASATELFNELLEPFDASVDEDDDNATQDNGTAVLTSLPQVQTLQPRTHHQSPLPVAAAGGDPGFGGRKPRLSLRGKIQIVRAIGVAIVDNGSMYPVSLSSLGSYGISHRAHSLRVRARHVCACACILLSI